MQSDPRPPSCLDLQGCLQTLAAHICTPCSYIGQGFDFIWNYLSGVEGRTFLVVFMGACQVAAMIVAGLCNHTAIRWSNLSVSIVFFVLTVWERRLRRGSFRFQIIDWGSIAASALLLVWRIVESSRGKPVNNVFLVPAIALVLSVRLYFDYGKRYRIICQNHGDVDLIMSREDKDLMTFQCHLCAADAAALNMV